MGMASTLKMCVKDRSSGCKGFTLTILCLLLLGTIGSPIALIINVSKSMRDYLQEKDFIIPTKCTFVGIKKDHGTTSCMYHCGDKGCLNGTFPCYEAQVMFRDGNGVARNGTIFENVGQLMTYKQCSYTRCSYSSDIARRGIMSVLRDLENTPCFANHNLQQLIQERRHTRSEVLEEILLAAGLFLIGVILIFFLYGDCCRCPLTVTTIGLVDSGED